MAKILAAGVAVLDIINYVDHYPHEDAEIRAKSRVICRGGNATNSLVVLSQLGHDCSWAGVIAEDPDAVVIRDDLLRYHINMDYVVSVSDGHTPVSYITLADNGSRTIIHYRDLPELQARDFIIEQSGHFDWIHFEGRNVADTLEIMKGLKNIYSHVPISVEVEKPRPGIESLFKYAGHVFFSKVYMHAMGFDDPERFLQSVHKDKPAALYYCGYGDKGVYAIDMEGEIFFSQAPAGVDIVDTLGAGDTLNAGLVHAGVKKLSMQHRLDLACELATRKCGQNGFEGLDVDGL